MKQIFKLFISIAACLLTGFLGSFFTAVSISGWYDALQKPFFNPPNWAFAPVWAVLYILMGISLFLVWRKNGESHSTAMMFFFVQLFLNLMWTVIFFGFKSPLYALFEIAFLWLAILATIIQFHFISRPAAYLLAPYILWVAYATVLNYSIWRMN